MSEGWKRLINLETCFSEVRAIGCRTQCSTSNTLRDKLFLQILDMTHNHATKICMQLNSFHLQFMLGSNRMGFIKLNAHNLPRLSFIIQMHSSPTQLCSQMSTQLAE